ncbi:MAG: hypothetical protein K0S18_161 [Anaerocolumna sp.]|jgi:hypothetical protein|nr:hypothetical protein [Anaerocolumna sp.]
MDENECRNKLVKGIMNDLLDNSIAASGYLGKKIKMSKVNIIDLYTLYDLNKDSLIKVKSFNNHIGKINYIFKVLETLAEKL